MASSPQDNVLLFGLGAVGAVYAFIAARAPNTKVYVCARSNFEVVSTQGLNMKSEKFGDHPNFMFAGAVKTPAASSIKDVKFSYIICANKAITMDPPASEQIAPAVSENTTIVLIQNGVGNDEEFRKRFPKNTILSGVTWVSANQPTTGTIVHNGNETMQFGIHWQDTLPREVQQKSFDHIVSLLRAGGTEIEVVESIDLWRWKKTVWNCTWNCLTALTLCNTAQFLNASGSGELVARRIIKEMNSIARAKGHIIEEEYLEGLITTERVWTGIYSSMCMDAAHSRSMEVDVIISTPLKFAKELGVETPTLDVINALICAMDWRFRNGIPAPGK